jgi:hypothetical protein
MSQRHPPFTITRLFSRIIRWGSGAGSLVGLSAFRSSIIGSRRSDCKDVASQPLECCTRSMQSGHLHPNMTMLLMGLNRRMLRVSPPSNVPGLSVRFASKKSSRSGDGNASFQDGSATRTPRRSAPVHSAAPPPPPPPPSLSTAASTVPSPAVGLRDSPKRKNKSSAVADPPHAVAAARSASSPTSDHDSQPFTAPIMPAIDVHHMSQQLSHTALPDILIVRTPQHAEAVTRHIIAAVAVTKVKQAVMQATHHASKKGQLPSLPVFAVDTETVGLNVKSKSKSSPVLWGQVLTMQVYAGPDFNFNPDPNGPACSKLFVDCAEHDLLHCMRDFFLSRDVPKVLHAPILP